MKKTYINPVMDIVTLQYHSHLMAVSGPEAGGSTGDPNDLLGRRFSGFVEDDGED